MTIRLPPVLAELAGTQRRVNVQGETLQDALADLVRRQPTLAIHLFDESGALRRHVRFFHNEDYARDGSLERPIAAGDTVTILNAVAGG